MSTICVNELSAADIYADLWHLIGGADNVEGIEILDVDYDESGLTITLGDTDGTTRAVPLVIDHVREPRL